MKILQLISSIGYYGAENVVFELAKGLEKKSIHTVIGLIRDQNPNPIEDQAYVHNLPIIIFNCKTQFDIRTILNIRNYVLNNHIDIIHSHNYKSNFYSIVSSYGLNVKLIATCHNWVGNSLKLRLYSKLDKILLQKFSQIVAVSGAVKSELIRSHIKVSKINEISNGVDTLKFINTENDVKNELSISEDKIVVGTVGRLSPEKGHEVFINAAKRVHEKYKNTVFLIVGDGPLINKLIEMSKDLPVIFLGSRDDIPKIYNAIDIFVLPSIDEGLPMVILEALSSKKPCIATNVGSLSKVIDHMENGIIVQSGKSIDLSDSICYLISNKKMALKFAEKGYTKVRKYFSSEKMVLEYIRQYMKCCMIR